MERDAMFPDVSKERGAFVIKGCLTVSVLPSGNPTVYQNVRKYQSRMKASHHTAPPQKRHPSLPSTLLHLLHLSYHSDAVRKYGSELLLPTSRRYAAAFVCGVGTFVMLAILPLVSPTHSATSVGGENDLETPLVSVQGP